MNYFLLLILFIPLNSLANTSNSSDSSSDKGLWSWSQDTFTTAKARSQLINFCKKEAISRVDQHLSIRKNLGRLFFENQQELATLLKASDSKNLTINALRGDKKMFFSENHSRTLEDLKLIIKFNQSHPKKYRLAGIKYDVEPYLTKEWKAGGQQRKKVMLDYLLCLTKIRAELISSKSSLKLHVDVPFWWDHPEHTLSYRGKKQPFTYHIQDLTDAISIMSYRRDASEVLKISSGELSYANKMGKHNSVSVGLETIKIEGKESFISFHDTPVSQYRETVTNLQQQLNQNKASSGIMIHQYRSLRPYLSGH